MAWTVELEQRAGRELRALDRPTAERILRFLRERIAGSEDPRRIGRPLKGRGRPLWRYRIGSFRLICSIEDEQLLVLVVAIGHRREIYR